MAYAAGKDGKTILVVDGKEVKGAPEGEERGYDKVSFSNFTFSPDSSKYACIMFKGDKLLVVEDGKAGETCEIIGDKTLVFSPDSRHLAYVACDNGKWHIVVDGKPGREYAGIADIGVVFSPDSRRCAYAVRTGAEKMKWNVVAYDMMNAAPVESKPYEGILKGSRIVFTSDKQLHVLVFNGAEIIKLEITVP